MPYDERLKDLHPYAMTEEQLRMESEHVSGLRSPGVTDPGLEHRLALIENAQNMFGRIMSKKPEQVIPSVEVEFSPALKEELIRRREISGQSTVWAKEYFEAHKLTKDDVRDFGVMVEYDEGMTPEQRKEKLYQYMDDYYSGDPAKRKKCLDSFSDRLDAVDPTKLDLSCLKRPGTTGDGSGVLTQSEKDLLTLLDRFHCDQGLVTKTQIENPEYFAQRYPTPQARARIETSRNAFSFSYNTYIANGLLPYNYLKDSFAEDKTGREHTLLDSASTVISGLERFKPAIAALEGIPYQRTMKTDLQDISAQILQRQPVARDTDGALTKQSANALSRVYEDLVGKNLEDEQRRIRTELGVRDSDVLFIDGVSAYELYGEKYSSLPREEQEKRIKQEVAAAALEGSHRFEVASLYPDATGTYKTSISPLQFDMHALDASEKSKRSSLRRAFDFGPFKIETTASRQDAMYQSDPKREERQSQIEQRFAATVTKRATDKHDAEGHDALETDKMAVTAAKQRIEEIEAANRGLRVRYGEIDAAQFKAESYSRAARKLGEAESRLEGMTGLMDDKTDISSPMIDSLHHAIPFGTDSDKKSELSKLYETRVTPGINRYLLAEKNLEASMDTLTQQLETEKKKAKPDQKTVDLLGKMIANPDPKARKELVDDSLHDVKMEMKAYLEKYRETLDSHPYREFANPAKMEERSKQLKELKGQTKQVPVELLKEAALCEAKAYMHKEDYEQLNPREIPTDKTGYIAPQTKEEALERIAEIDQRSLSVKPFMMIQEGLGKGSGIIPNPGIDSVPRVREDVGKFLQHMESLEIDTGVLEESVCKEYQSHKAKLELMAKQKPDDPIPLTDPTVELPRMCGQMISAKAAAFAANPEYLRYMATSEAQDQYHKDLRERECLIRDLAHLEREAEKTRGAEPEEVRAQAVTGESAKEKSEDKEKDKAVDKTEGKEKDKAKDKTEDTSKATKRRSMDFESLSREAKEAGEVPAARQRSRSLGADEMKKPSQGRSKSESQAAKTVR